MQVNETLTLSTSIFARVTLCVFNLQKKTPEKEQLIRGLPKLIRFKRDFPIFRVSLYIVETIGRRMLDEAPLCIVIWGTSLGPRRQTIRFQSATCRFGAAPLWMLSCHSKTRQRAHFPFSTTRSNRAGGTSPKRTHFLPVGGERTMK